MGLNAFFKHFLHLILPSIIFLESARIFALQFLQTNMFLYNLACAAGNFVAIFYILQYNPLFNKFPL